jgi:ribosomal protein S18 acetylase RimI-like enzyme
MGDSALDNPFWASLQSRHKALAQGSADIARFPSSHAPFLGVANAGIDVVAALDPLIGPDETVYLLGVATAEPRGWTMRIDQPLAQMACESPIEVIDGPPITELSDDAHRADAMALTALVYPHFFRARTMELGRYFGIYQGSRLAAMIGERLGTDDAQEISAICTHPDFTVRGYSRRLLAMLTNDNLQRGRLAFLHVNHKNLRAKSMYERIGYNVRRDIDFWSLRRTARKSTAPTDTPARNQIESGGFPEGYLVPEDGHHLLRGSASQIRA